MDARSLTNLNTLHPDPEVRADAIEAWTEAQAIMPVTTKIIVIQGIRTFAESDEDFEIGRTKMNEDGPKPGKPFGDIITKAAAGQSYHNYALAWDFAMVTNGKDDYVVGPLWMKVVEIMEKHGWQWGGNFPLGQCDYPHFEKHFGLKWSQLLQLHQAKKFLPGTAFVDFRSLLK